MRGTQMAPGGFGFDVTDLTKRVLVALVGLYIGQLVLTEWVGLPLVSWLAWQWAPAGTFYPWQVVTAYLLNGPTPLAAFFDWLAIFFFLGPAERALGRRGLLRSVLVTLAISAVLGFVLLLTGAVTARGPFIGLNPLITALIVVFGLANPNASILLFFVLPIKAAWIAWGSGLFALLNFLAFRDLDSALWLTGWFGGYATIRAWQAGGWNKLVGRASKAVGKSQAAPRRGPDAATRARRRGFEIIEGGGQGADDEDEDEDHGGSDNGGGRPWWSSRDDEDGGPIVH